MQLGEQDLKQGLDRKSFILVVEEIFRCQKVEQAADKIVFQCLERRFKRDVSHANERLVRIEANPVVAVWFFFDFTVFDQRKRRIQDRRMSGHDKPLAVNDKIRLDMRLDEQPPFMFLVGFEYKAGGM